MKISSKGRYAVRIMIDIAKNGTDFVSVAEIAQRQNISVKYLENIIAKLVKAKLLISMRGVKGGYKLSKNPNEYSIKEILDITGDTSDLVACAKQNCPRQNSCDSKKCWLALQSLINDFLDGVTLQNLIDKSIL